MGHLQGILSGKKVYLLGLLAIVGAAVGFLTGDLTLEQALETAWTGGLAMAGRAAIAKIGGPPTVQPKRGRAQ